MVVYNSNEQEKSTTTARYTEIMKGKVNAKNVITGESMNIENLTIPAKSTLVLELLK